MADYFHSRLVFQTLHFFSSFVKYSVFLIFCVVGWLDSSDEKSCRMEYFYIKLNSLFYRQIRVVVFIVSEH